MKFLRYFLAFILVSLFFLVAIISVKLDAILHDAINTHGSKLLGTDVRIKKINLDLFNGDLKSWSCCKKSIWIQQEKCIIHTNFNSKNKSQKHFQ